MELLDGVLIDLLKTKWNTFVKSRFYRQFYLFTAYFLVSLVSFTLRPGPVLDTDDDGDTNGDGNDDKVKNGTVVRQQQTNSRYSSLENVNATRISLSPENPSREHSLAQMKRTSKGFIKDDSKYIVRKLNFEG